MHKENIRSKEEWENLPEQKARRYKDLREDIQNSFDLVKKNYEFLTCVC
jgi:hypothetical protein